MIGRSILDFVLPEQHGAMLRLRKGLLNGELRSGRSEYRVVTAKGSELWSRAESVAISWKGAPATLNIASDITELKRVEAALRESEEKYSLVVQKASEAIFVVQDGIVVFANPASFGIIGGHEREVIGRNILEFVLPEQKETMLHLRQMLLRGELRSGRTELKVLTLKGTELWARVDSVAISWKGAPAILNIASDITGSKRTELELRKSGSEVRSMNVELERRVAERTS